MDYLKDISIQIHGKIKKQNHQDFHFNEISVRKLVVSDFKGFKITIHEFGELFSIQITVESELALSINKPNRLFRFTNPVLLESVPYIIYSSDECQGLIKREPLKEFWISFGELLQQIKLIENESVIVYRNAICFALNVSRDIVGNLEKVLSFLTANNKMFKKARKKSLRLRNIPDDLKSIIPFLKKYSFSDDVERQEMLESMVLNDKMNLVNAVAPLMLNINNYLASFNGKPLDNEATLIGNLAELVSELEIEME